MILTNTFATNLPDQRVQWDLSGQNLPGGGSGTTAATQKNVWVEFNICHPFAWKPGQALVVDITAKSKVGGQYCRSAIGAGVPRMLNLAYTPRATTGTAYTSGGIKLRFVFAPMYAPYVLGTGCAGTNRAVPKLTATGKTKIGNSGIVIVNMTNARPNAANFLVVGLTCIDLPIFGGCTIYPQLHILLGGSTNATGGTGTVFPVPKDPTLDGISITLQYAIDDPNTAARPYTFSLSNGLRLTLNK